jgi:pimeloyl-ACP methyl ester carboxylesterase
VQDKTNGDNPYWRTYCSDEILRRSDAVRQVHTIRSTDVEIHIDVYPHPATDAPVVIFNHGAAGYCRLFASMALLFNDCGFTVVLPDQRGQGLSGGTRGDYTLQECVQNIVDVAWWAKRRFQTPLHMAGGSVGGGLTYYAAAAGAPVAAIACLNLFDFGNGGDGIRISRFSPLARNASLVKLMRGCVTALRPLYGLRIPFAWVGAFHKLMDGRDAEFQAQWDADPVPPRLVSLRSLASNMTTPPAVLFEQNRIPTLVINQSLDEMVDPGATRNNYDRLGGPKDYLEVPFGHWSSQPEFWETIVGACVEWFRQHVPA